MRKRGQGAQAAAESRPGTKEKLEQVRVEGVPDADRMMAALEWLLYRRGPLARMMRRSS